jgi:phage portal protein BeeE
MSGALVPLSDRHGMPLFARKDSRTGPAIYMLTMGQPRWTPRDYAALAKEGYQQNPVVFRSIKKIAEAFASVDLLLYKTNADGEDQDARRQSR